MSIWKLSNTCFVDFDKGEVCCIKNNKMQVYPFGKLKYVPSILKLFVENNGKSFSSDDISKIWEYSDETASCSPHDVSVHISKLKKFGEIKDYIKSNKIGEVTIYTFECPVAKKVDCILNSNNKDLIKYFDFLWNRHYKGSVRDNPWSESNKEKREIIDYYVLPNISKLDNNPLEFPFFQRRDQNEVFRAFITAGSGYGKTVLLRLMILVNIYFTMNNIDDVFISNNSKQKEKEYLKIKNYLFGESAPNYFPIFIESAKYNDLTECEDIIKLAEGYNIGDNTLPKMIRTAEQEGNLLIILDALDEVKSDQQGEFLRKVKEMISNYPKASVVITSRFEKDYLPFDFINLRISELDKTRINKITELYKDFCSLNKKSREIINLKHKKILENELWFSLAKNPYMLLFILDYSKGDNIYLFNIIADMVDAIVKRRWCLGELGNADTVKLLLGGLACSCVFQNNKSEDYLQSENQVRNSIKKAQDLIKSINMQYNISDCSINYMIELLSIHSGILNIKITNAGTRYLFQDNIVMCWLASYYINKCLQNAPYQNSGDTLRWDISYLCNNIINAFSGNNLNKGLSEFAVNTLVMALSQIDKNSRDPDDLQAGILYFLLFKDALSLNEAERSYILQGYYHIKNATFGENQITIKENSPCSKMIDNAIEKHKTDKTTKDQLEY